MSFHVGSMAYKGPYVSVTTGWYSIHALRFTSPLQTKDRHATYSALNALFSTAASRYRTPRSTTAIARNFQQPTATCCNMCLAGQRERHCTGRFPSDRLGKWNDVTTHTFASSGQAVHAVTSELSAPRPSAGSSHSFSITKCLLFHGTFSFGGHVQTPPVTPLWHG
jgi:hypothetical protein